MSRLITHIVLSAALLAGALLVGWIALSAWASQLMPALMFVCAVALPLTGLAALIYKLDPERGLGARDGLVWAAQVALLTGLMASWSLPAMRRVAARVTPERALSACLHDPSGDVVRTCCERLGQSATGHQGVLGRWLMDHDRVPMACAVQAFDGKTPEANTVARLLVERWEDQLIAAKEPVAPPADERAGQAEREGDEPLASQPEAPLCELAAYMRHMDRVPGTHSGLRLLQCALRASHPEAQQCCAAQLHQLTAQTGDWTNALGPPELTLRTNLSTRLLLLLPRLLNPPDARAAEQLRAMRLDSSSGRRWSLGAACALTEHETPRVSAEASAHLQLTLLLGGCEEVTGLRPRAMQRICSRWAEEAAPAPVADHDERLLCGLARGEAVGAAAYQARIFFARARAQGRSAARSEDPLVQAILSAPHNSYARNTMPGMQRTQQLKLQDQIQDIWKARHEEIAEEAPEMPQFLRLLSP